jgi:RNA polymerase sigma factor (sigma-70 family)
MELPPAEPSDEELVARAVAGDRTAYRALYQRTAPLVRSRLAYLLGPDNDSEDVAQQIFLEVFAHLEHFRGDARFRTFLWRVAANVAIDHRASRSRRPTPIGQHDLDVVRAVEPSPEQHAEQRQSLDLVLGLLERIKPKKRTAFTLRVIDGLSLEEVAHEVRAKPATVGLRIRTARAELEGLLAQAGRPRGSPSERS